MASSESHAPNGTSRVTFGHFKGRIFHPGQTDSANKTCSKCLQSGHLRSSCVNEVVCRCCKQTGHIEARCPTHDTPTVSSNQRPGNVQSSRWSLQPDTQRVLQRRYEGQDTDSVPYDTDFPHVARQPDKRPNQKRSNSQPRMTRSWSRALPTTSTNRRHHDNPDTDDRRFTFATGDNTDQRSRGTSTRAPNATQPSEPAPTASRPSEVAPNRPERSLATADQITPPKLTNHQQSKITQFIEKARLNSDRENNVEPADRSVSDRCSPDENTSYDSASSQEDESVSAEYSECEEDTVTEHQSDLSAESPDPVTARNKMSNASKRKQKSRKKTSKKR
nr:uncharacterized protein LOC129267367 [Lytechinus pictus]